MNDTFTYFIDRDKDYWKVENFCGQGVSSGEMYLYDKIMQRWNEPKWRDTIQMDMIMNEMELIQISKDEMFLDLL